MKRAKATLINQSGKEMIYSYFWSEDDLRKWIEYYLSIAEYANCYCVTEKEEGDKLSDY